MSEVMSLAGPHPYPAYKPSGVPWLGDVPAHWEVRRLKQVCSKSALYGANVAATEYQPEGIRFLRTTDIGEDGRLLGKGVYLPPVIIEDYVLSDGDLLLSRSGTVGRGFLYSTALHGPCAYAGYLVRFVPNQQILPKYLFLFTKTTAFNSFLRTMAISSTIENVNAEKYANGHLPLPPLAEQRAIVRYLDCVDRRIRRYVTAKRKLIALLEEEKQAIVSRAVTRGLDPNVRLKPSGVEWLGEVPEHWEVRRLKTLCSMRSGEAITAESIETTGEYPVYGGNGLRGYASNYTHDGAFALIGRQGALCGNVHIARDKFWASEHAVVASLQPGHVLEWFGAVLQTMNLNQYSIAAAQPGLAVERILNLWLPVPPPEEQETMAIRIGLQTADIDSAIVRARRQIELLQEYRTRLIADVVTGKLDVREAAAQLPDEADDQDPIGETAPLVDGLPGDLYEIDESVEDSVMEEEVPA